MGAHQNSRVSAFLRQLGSCNVLISSPISNAHRINSTHEAAAAVLRIHADLYRPDIDGLRAVAAVAVVVAHAGWLRGGGFGVDIFFVISGFLISGIILRALQDGCFSLLEFYARRVKRIFPALVVLLTSVSIFGWIILPSAEYRRLGIDVATGAGFVENLWFYALFRQNSVVPGFALGHLWTLGIEEQFYLVWPLFLMTVWLLLRRWQLRLIATTVVLSLGSYVWVLFTDRAGWLLPWNRLWELALGAMLTYLQHIERTATQLVWMTRFLQPSISRYLGIIGAICVIVALTGHKPLDKWPSGYVWVPVLGAFLMIAAGREQWINRVLATRPMVFIGLISYPLYLWHWPLFTFAAILHDHAGARARDLPVTWKVIVIVASLVLSYATYKYIELPLRASRNTRGVALLLCIAMALCGGAAYFVLG